MNLLLIEDNQGDIQMFDIILSELLPSHNLTVLNSGHKALDYIKTFNENTTPPDLIIVDMQLPKTSGLIILKMLKGNSLLSKYPVYIFTSASDENLKSAALSTGASGYYIKPILLEDYISTIKNMLNLNHQAASA